MTEATLKLTKDQEKRRKARNWALLAVLAGLVLLFYLLTIVRWGAH